MQQRHTGLKVYGEGEWEARRHGYSGRRTWRKPHPAIAAEGHEIQAVAVTGAGVDAAAEVDHRREPIDRPVARAAADGADDKREVDRAPEPRAGRILTPPRKDARIGRHGDAGGPPRARDADLRPLRRVGRRAWKRELGDQIRSLAETGVFRMRAVGGGHLASRGPDRQVTGGAIRCRAWDIRTDPGMPDSYEVA